MSELTNAEVPRRLSFMKQAGLYRVRIDEVEVRELPTLRPRQLPSTGMDEEVELSNPMRPVRVVVEYTCLEGAFEGQQFSVVYTRAVEVDRLLKELEQVDPKECFLNINASNQTSRGVIYYVHSWWPLRLRQVLNNFVPY